MISRLRGCLLAKKPPQVLIEVNGVGYDVQAPMSTIFNLPEVGQEVILHIEFVVREDAHKLFGFLTEFERALFNKITKVSGIGPKIGLAILSSIAPEQFIKTIQKGEVNALVSLPGVGKKTAERLVLELKDKFEPEWVSSILTNTIFSPDHLEANAPVSDAKEALISLGYSVKEVDQIMNKINTSELQTLSSEAIIKMALSRLVKVPV